MLREESFTLGKRKINAAIGPNSGPTLLLFHGVTRRWQSFVPLLPALTLRYRVVAVDFAGHGHSDRSNIGYQVVDYIRDAREIVEQFVEGPLFIYGHSLGGMVAAQLAADYPDRVQATVLEDPPFDTMGSRIASTSLMSFFRGMQPLAAHRGSVAEITAGLSELMLSDPEHNRTLRLGELRDVTSLRFTASCLHQLDPDVLLPIITGTWMEGFDRHDLFGRIYCPTLLMQADTVAGGMLTDSDADEAEALCPALVRLRFPGVGHLLHWWSTPSVLSHVVAFLESTR